MGAKEVYGKEKVSDSKSQLLLTDKLADRKT